ncbi:PREDICTED: OTU domain-containing protein DDB_G0284757-like isoform X1 [Lupinus angustifolius]|nr:PREDICTED: OTU domain-containing protein DDB_G0284757-like isoform X1 [Lupinus angustifolius]XP_019460974.1 PREDICTED: OTU domain-containing protein DDB_G0284757-like isoform X1 [Lupinus angustifolius]XP_019460975.1 PREDICTED: OTU domain-containing protein DDB_G0284757-like isoform X1 [Lupinus angustifolius]
MCFMGHMATYDIDSDVVQWGLHLLDVCTFSNSGSPSIITQYDPDLSQIQYVREGFSQPTYVENDEAVARAYQEELSRLESIEASGRSNYDNENLRESVLAQDWIASNGNYNYGNQSCQNTIDEQNNMKEMEKYAPSERDNNDHEIEVFGSSSESGEIPVTSDDFRRSLEVSDESSLDGEVGKRLNQMIPTRHTPKINEKIPSDDEEISDHERLLDRLQLYDVIERKVEGDGNCQFRSLSDQLYRSPEHHKFVRKQIIQQLESFPELYSGYVPMAYFDYLKKMSKSGEWGDHVTLQAAADCYGVKIFVITSFKDTCYIEILPQIQKSGRVIFLSFWAEVHYNPIYPEGGDIFVHYVQTM